MYKYLKDGFIVFDVAILQKAINDLTPEELNIYKLFTFLRSNNLAFDKSELKMYLANNLIIFERGFETIKDDYLNKVIKVENIYFYINGKKKHKVYIDDFYEKNESIDEEDDLYDYFEYVLKKDSPTNLELKSLSNEEKIDIVMKFYKNSWYDDDSFDFEKSIRSSYQKLFSYEELVSILKSFDELWNYIKDDIEELKDLKSLVKYLKKESFANSISLVIQNPDGTREVFRNHAKIEIYSKKRRINNENFSKVKKAYEKGEIYLELDDENIVGFKVKDLKNIVTNEKIEDTFSIDFFRYDAPGNLLETNNIALVKSIYSNDEISQMICESIDICFEEIRNSIFEKIK